MDDDQELSGIHVLRLFPLPGVVLFPHCILPLHIFEPRYRQMTEDALESDRLVTMVMVRPSSDWQGMGPPTLEEFACVGRILKSERLPDGRYNFLLVGLKRVRLLRELDGDRLYRTAEAEVIDDLPEDSDETERLRSTLIDRFRALHGKSGGVDPDLETLLAAELPLGVLGDILAHSLQLPPDLKQRLLAEPEVDPRIRRLIAWIEQAIRQPDDADQARRPPSFPPPFSTN